MVMSDWIEADPAELEAGAAINVPGTIEPEPGIPQQIYNYTDPRAYLNQLTAAPPPPSPVEQLRSRAASGPVEAGVLAAGKELRDLYTGIQQAAIIDPAKSAALQAEYEGRQAQFAPTEEQYPISTFLGEAAPYTLMSGPAYKGTEAAIRSALKYKPVQLASMTTPGKLGAISGGLEGLLTGYIHPGMTPLEGAVAGGLGGGVGGGLGRILSRRPTELTRQDEEMIKAAKEMKISLLPGDLTRIPEMMKMDASLLANPRTAKPYEDIKRYNTQQLNQRIFQSTGAQDITNITANDIIDIEQDLSRRYKDLISQSKGKFDENLLEGFDSAVKTAERRLGTKSKFLNTYYDRLDKISDDNLDISGKAYQQLYSDITDQYGKRVNSTSPKAKTEATALKAMRDSLVKNVEEGLPENYKGKWGELRSQYAATRMLLDNNVIDPSGNVNYKRLANVLKRKGNVKNYQRESGPWKEMIKAAKVGEWMSSKPRYWVSGQTGIGRAVKPSLTGAILGRGSELPFAGRGLSAAYRSGYPHITGLAGLPAQSPEVLSILGASGSLGSQD